MQEHPFDIALRLEPAGDNRWRGTTSASYWNMVGPFGGITAAVVLKAVMQHPSVLGAPLSLTVNYAGPISGGAFVIEALPVRTNRSTQHWTVTISQPDEHGSAVASTFATVVTALRRETWGTSDMPMPAVAPVAEVPALPAMNAVEWLNRYELRLMRGLIPDVWDGRGVDGLSQLWMRDAPARQMDFCSLAALSDIFFPRVWLRRAVQVPAGTVSITTYFHANAQDLAEVGQAHVLGQARALEYRNGFFDQSAQIWSAAGRMLATSHQIVYFKE